MKEMFKIMLILFVVFTTIFIFAKITGLLSLEQIEGWLTQTRNAPTIYIMAIVIALLFLDLFVTVPTLSLIMLSGYFLGYPLAVLASVTGLMIAGCSGYLLSFLYGSRVLRFLIKDDEKREDMKSTFHKHGFAMILLSRALPMLPEVTACLSGSTRMPFPKFLAAWSLSSVPYVLIAAYSGSISSLGNPMPAIFTAIGITSVLWLGWFLFHRKHKKIAANG
ncbi:MAG: VTT domain-containing protein [Alphaproteobacteria bacterium]|nr:VTT domain-containing protein [Alphaproteobacteria bacterium]